MQESCVAFSLLPGRGESARDFMRQLTTGRRAGQEQSLRRLRLERASWYLAAMPAGEVLIGVLGGVDPLRSIGLLAVSMEPHDLWFKRRFAELTGIDLNDRSAVEEAIVLPAESAPAEEPLTPRSVVPLAETSAVGRP